MFTVAASVAAGGACAARAFPGEFPGAARPPLSRQVLERLRRAPGRLAAARRPAEKDETLPEPLAYSMRDSR
jgi:hypothetical protein